MLKKVPLLPRFPSILCQNKMQQKNREKLQSFLFLNWRKSLAWKYLWNSQRTCFIYGERKMRQYLLYIIFTELYLWEGKIGRWIKAYNVKLPVEKVYCLIIKNFGCNNWSQSKRVYCLSLYWFILYVAKDIEFLSLTELNVYLVYIFSILYCLISYPHMMTFILYMFVFQITLLNIFNIFTY